MNVSPTGIALLQYFEKCRLDAYQDGGGVWTIGWGETQGVRPGMKWTQQQADDRFKARLVSTASEVTRVAKRPMQQSQFDGFCCFAYNVGITAFANSTMLLKFNEGREAADEFMRWVKDGASVVAGLGVRRACERMLFKGRIWEEGK